MNTRFYRHIEEKTRANDRREEKERAEAGEESRFPESAPPLLIKLRHTLGKLPAAGIVYECPYEVAVRLIRYRHAIPVASFDSRPDLVISDGDLQYTGLPPELIPLELSVEASLEAA